MSDIKKTIETLEAFSRWSKVEDGFLVEDTYTAREIGSAIDDACDLLKQHIKLKEELTKAVNECIKLTRVVNEYNRNDKITS